MLTKSGNLVKLTEQEITDISKKELEKRIKDQQEIANQVLKIMEGGVKVAEKLLQFYAEQSKHMADAQIKEIQKTQAAADKMADQEAKKEDARIKAFIKSHDAAKKAESDKELDESLRVAQGKVDNAKTASEQEAALKEVADLQKQKSENDYQAQLQKLQDDKEQNDIKRQEDKDKRDADAAEKTKKNKSRRF
jgi:ABC-type Na+ efflux pump permease subunit